MNFFTSLAQLRHGFGGGAEAPKDHLSTTPELTKGDFQFDAPAYKASLELEPPAPILDDAAIMARAALAAQAVADAAEVEYAKHTYMEEDDAPSYDAMPEPQAELDQPLDAFEADIPEMPEVSEMAEAPAPRLDLERAPFLSAQEFYEPPVIHEPTEDDTPVEASAEEPMAEAHVFDEFAFVTEVPEMDSFEADTAESTADALEAYEPEAFEADAYDTDDAADVFMPEEDLQEEPFEEDTSAFEDTLIADMMAQDSELDAPLMEEVPMEPEAEVVTDTPVDAVSVSVETFEVSFDVQDAAPVLMIEDFDPATDTLEIELIREPGDDRDLQSTDMAVFLNHDGAYGTDIVLRMAETEGCAPVCSTLRLVSEADIDLEAVQIDIANAAA